MAAVGTICSRKCASTGDPEGDNGIVRLAKQWMERIDPMAHETSCAGWSCLTDCAGKMRRTR